mgnify:FL=1
MKVYTLRDLKNKLLSLGLDHESVSILLNDVEVLLNFEYNEGLEDGLSKQVSNCDCVNLY